MAAGAHRPTALKGRATGRHYALSGLVFCGQCGRPMQGTSANETARYRCRYPSEFALANTLDHPQTVYVPESAISPRLDAWLAELFSAANLDATCEALAWPARLMKPQKPGPRALRRKLAACDQRLAKYRKALDAGANPVVVADRMAEVQGERLRAEAELAPQQHPAASCLSSRSRDWCSSYGTSPPSLPPPIPRTRPRSTVSSAFRSTTTRIAA